jgi:anion-transporting  ArsA/GET3 family ATPase
VNLFDKRLILVAGKGGVGRSTVAATIAAASARRGRKTLLYEYNANDRWGDFFGAPPVGSSITRLRDNLYAVNTTPHDALEEYGMMVLRFKRVYQMVFENRVTKYFLRAVPGLDDYSILGKVWYHTTEEKAGRPVWDTVVFDMAASGHALSMLKLPWVIVDTVPEGPLTVDARSIRELLLDRRRTSLVLVTLAEEMPVNEARELAIGLSSQLGIEIARLIINQVSPDRFPAGSPQRSVLDALDDASLSADLAAAAAHSRLAAARRALNETYIAEARKAIAAPHSELPLLFVPSLGPTEIDTLSQIADRELGPRAS